MDVTNANVAVLGFGVEGESVVRFILGKAQSVHVFYEQSSEQTTEEKKRVWEDKGVVFHSGRFCELSSYDVIFRSPGIRPDIPVLTHAREAGKIITSGTNLFFDLCPCPIIGVTGTKGKGTTSSLIVEMIKEDGKRKGEKGEKKLYDTVFLGGNIGTPPLDFLAELTNNSLVVLELSSFQLMDCPISPHVGVLLMVVPEHLNWHTSVDEYIQAKAKLFSSQTSDDYAVINMDYPLNRSLLPSVNGRVLTVSSIPNDHSGSYVSDSGYVVYQNHGVAKEIITTKDIRIPGSHNWENACAAVVVAKILDLSSDSIRTVLKTFSGLPHRLELVGKVHDVSYYNDSFSTTPETAIAAIRAFVQPKVLILGGSTKQSDFTELGKVIAANDSIRGIIGIGEEWEKIKESIKQQGSSIPVIEGCRNMEEIIRAATTLARAGDVVLLSPGCASFGMFQNYKDRGNQFRTSVQNLVASS